jgi:uncharacterized protein (DUF433 family)
MTLDVQAFPPPLRVDDHGVVRLGQTRIRFDFVVDLHRQGKTPEEIAATFSSPPDLADVYGAIGYYLHNREAADAYIAQLWAEEAEIERDMRERFPQDGLKERLLARRAEMHGRPPR